MRIRFPDWKRRSIADDRSHVQNHRAVFGIDEIRRKQNPSILVRRHGCTPAALNLSLGSQANSRQIALQGQQTRQTCIALHSTVSAGWMTFGLTKGDLQENGKLTAALARLPLSNAVGVRAIGPVCKKRGLDKDAVVRQRSRQLSDGTDTVFTRQQYWRGGDEDARNKGEENETKNLGFVLLGKKRYCGAVRNALLTGHRMQ